ncbi:hypothetical protein COT87_01205, partial [Candidatus Collierbacteria bacterium CG10_big_fil_rev_8_21_14_0_10_44_9]
MDNPMDKKLKILQPMRYWWLYFIISLAVIIPGSYSLTVYGLKPSIDFTGGTTIVWDLQTDEENLRRIAQEDNLSIQSISHKNDTWTIGTKSLDREAYQTFKAKFEGVKELSFDTVGPALGDELI